MPGYWARVGKANLQHPPPVLSRYQSSASFKFPHATHFIDAHFGYGFGLLAIGEGGSNRWIDRCGRLKMTSGEIHLLDSPTVLVSLYSQSGLPLLIAPQISTNLQLHTAFIERLGGWIHE